jgi:predicted TIM-barrel fold metal-dependent hydrolase
MEVIDSHIHFWEPDRPERPWDKGGVNIGPPLSVEQLLADASAAGVTKVVQVTPTIMGYDNRYGLESAAKYPERIAGVFGRVDPLAPDMTERLQRYRRQPHALGVRLTLLAPPFTDWLTDGTLDRFVGECGRQGVPLAIYAPRQAHALGAILSRHPQARVLVDHMTLRHQDAEPFELWSDVLALAALPNLWIKVSYFPEVSHEKYPFKDVQPRFDELYRRFGPERLIWGSNYPPSARASTYKENVEFTRASCAFLSEEDKGKIFAKNFLRALGR